MSAPTPRAAGRVDLSQVAAGFDDPVHDAQGCYRVLLQALAEPARPLPLAGRVDAPSPFTPAAAAIALTLFDRDTPLWLDPALATGAVRAFLRFHTGAPLVAVPADAGFAIVEDTALLPLARFAAGSDVAPESSATVIVQVGALAADGPWQASGPGIATSRRFGIVGWPATLASAFLADWQAQWRRFPCGLDIVFAAPDAVLGLPRTTRLEGI